MHIKAIVSATAISAALMFGGFAYAQDAAATAETPTMIGNQTLGEGDAERVKVFCEDLQTSANQAVGAEGTDTETGTSTMSNDDSAEDSQTTVGSVDTSSITVETCLEAGFITEPVTP